MTARPCAFYPSCAAVIARHAALEIPQCPAIGAPFTRPRRCQETEKARVAALGQKLRDLHTERFTTMDAIDARLASPQLVADERTEKWFWADVADVAHWKRINTTNLRGKELTEWAKATFDAKVSDHLAEIEALIAFGMPMAASERNGELRFFVGDRKVISGVFVSALAGC